MKRIHTILLAAVIAVIILAVLYMAMTSSGKETACTASGGNVGVSTCCTSANDFPNTCLIGACGCSPSDSHDVKSCVCPSGKCFDGNSCVAIMFQ